MTIERKTTVAWYADERKVIEEDRRGHYQICDWHYLDEEGLRRVHSVLGEVLTDLADKKAKCHPVLMTDQPKESL